MRIKSFFQAALPAFLTFSLLACGEQTNTQVSDNTTSAPVTEHKQILVGVPNDATNEARALLLLQENGLIKLKDGVGLEATANDIAGNPYNIKLVESPAEMVSRTLQDVDFAVINGNYA